MSPSVAHRLEETIDVEELILGSGFVAVLTRRLFREFHVQIPETEEIEK